MSKKWGRARLSERRRLNSRQEASTAIRVRAIAICCRSAALALRAGRGDQSNSCKSPGYDLPRARNVAKTFEIIINKLVHDNLAMHSSGMLRSAETNDRI